MDKPNNLHVIAINGYGVGEDVRTDTQISRYLSAIVPKIERRHADLVVCLLGGKTNRSDKSEARYLLEWFEHFAPGLNVVFILIEPESETRDLVDNLAAMHDAFGNPKILDFYCVHGRAWKAEQLLNRHFDNFFVHGVNFVEHKSVVDKIKTRAKWLIHDVVTVLGIWVPPLNDLRISWRKKHLAAARAQNQS
ncbi:MAG: hypothetical protein QG607_300 [Patescibacteria group bacterium]|jgi:hypothetical protein|nr:hypothetical protein [Patescibacteria group bacterium]